MPLPVLRLALNPDDDAAFLRIMNSPPRGVSEKVQQVLLETRDARWTRQQQQLRRQGGGAEGGRLGLSLLAVARHLSKGQGRWNSELGDRQADALANFVKLVKDLQVGLEAGRARGKLVCWGWIPTCTRPY